MSPDVESSKRASYELSLASCFSTAHIDEDVQFERKVYVQIAPVFREGFGLADVYVLIRYREPDPYCDDLSMETLPFYTIGVVRGVRSCMELGRQ